MGYEDFKIFPPKTEEITQIANSTNCRPPQKNKKEKNLKKIFP